ncbi:MAG TPA: phytanoyl-CoA dioxygenase family protein [Caulobacteraceae bacterium]|jgi:ectoine hydroxylase-related dioxygenase (phytanoyl-CoA dioxygenase family)
MEPDKFEAKLAGLCDPETLADARTFLDQGFVVLPDSIGQDLCNAALEQFAEFERRNVEICAANRDGDGHYPRIVNLHLVLPALRDLFSRNSRALKLQDFLFGDETVLYTSLFYERGSAQDLHRDTPYFCTRPEYRYFGMWIALEDVDEDNGPLAVMRGGHLMPELDRETLAREIFGAPENARPHSDEAWVAYQDRVAANGHELGLSVQTVPVRKGSTILWHPQLPHGGAPIRDIRRTRYSLVIHTTPAGVPVYHQDAFFNPSRPLPLQAPWSYRATRHRRYADHATISFNHKQDFEAASLSVS